ncbi:BNR repeat-containing family member [Sinomicrobium oceani]|uniref:BNR repeat-containing family member n=1 Tax=Sinomicrobium oceani TaxID=1150368 RepID=A0A1K1MNV5_9FLAO|nr:BNR repeat-containing protein [Sinomicrobium oceani]SFW24852.1 BNR repeat-containing family member [Sinomicrobium oceani]
MKRTSHVNSGTSYGKNIPVTVLALWCAMISFSQEVVRETMVGKGWAGNSVNAVIFRKNSVVSYKNMQFTGYYDEGGVLTLAMRKLKDTVWTVRKTVYKGKVSDAHNTISMAIDGDGYLHVSWDHHNTPLRYARSLRPLDLELGAEQPMTGAEEAKVTYPEFYNLPGGDLLFFYRSGSSGRGNMVVNRYDTKHKVWKPLHRNLIDGEEERSAYWQACVDDEGVIHLSWVWRETWDVASNHDLCYARSYDGGKSWEKSTGEKYGLPIREATAEYAWRVPENSGLINQTSMTSDSRGNPYIATYWNSGAVTQYQVVYLQNGTWKKQATGFRKVPFRLGGGGTKKIPLSRPQLLLAEKKGDTDLYLIFRDEERGNKVSLAGIKAGSRETWSVSDLSSSSVGQWEPSYDTQLWRDRGELHLFVQDVSQEDGEGLTEKAATDIRVLEISGF